MSPVVLQDAAWTHLPPAQFVEQHSAPDAHAFPRVTQDTLFAASAGAAHRPFAHVPEQHCAAPEQLCPSVAHAAAPHLPPEHDRSQHSAFAVQLSPAGLQNCEELHLCVAPSQAVEQHSEPLAQFSPPPLHAAWTGAAQFPPLHWPEQQSEAAEHAPDDRHWPAGSTQRLAAHALVQQSALDPQAAPTALHAAGSTQVPLHAPEQQSDGSTQAVPGAWHAGGCWTGSCGTGEAACCDEPQAAPMKPAHTRRRATTPLARSRILRWCSERAEDRKDGTCEPHAPSLRLAHQGPLHDRCADVLVPPWRPYPVTGVVVSGCDAATGRQPARAHR